MASYKPDIRCNIFAGPPLESCNNIFSDMHVDKNRQTYGHLPDQRVQVQLPVTYTSGMTTLLLTHVAFSLYDSGSKMYGQDRYQRPTNGFDLVRSMGGYRGFDSYVCSRKAKLWDS